MRARLTTAFRSASLSAVLVFIIAFSTPLLLGGPGAHQGPLVAFILAPVVFCAAFVLALIWPPLGKVVALLTLAYPVWYYVEAPTDKGPTLQPLTAQERELLRSTRLDLRVAVAPGKFPEVYQTGLIRELKKTGLLKEVGKLSGVDSPDLIATITGSYYGDKEGQSFSLHLSREPERKVQVKVWHYIPGILYKRQTTLYREHLALEVIRAIEELRSQDTIEKQSKAGGSFLNRQRRI